MASDPGLVYRLPGASWSLQIHADAAKVLRAQRQGFRWMKERVGQMYSEGVGGPTIVINRVTSLRPVLAGPTRVQFDPREAYKERESLFQEGLHCVGLWHTHPERLPSPSGIDESLARDHALAAHGVLTGIVFVIVGTASLPQGLYVGVHDGQRLQRANSESPRDR